MNRFALFLIIIIAGCNEAASPEDAFSISTDELETGYAFLRPDTQALQDDDFANPGFLWVDKGAALFQTRAPNGKSCSTCHNDDEAALAGRAATYPKHHADSDKMINLEGRINLCRTRFQETDALPYESDGLLALTAYVGNLSRGSKLASDITPQTQKSFERGQTYFMTRRGQLNLSCSQCHDDNWGKNLRGDTISQGHGNGFPAYRLEWQELGSLHRRFQYCDRGVKAEPLQLGSDTYIDLEYYLTRRAMGLKVETPAVRR